MPKDKGERYKLGTEVGCRPRTKSVYVESKEIKAQFPCMRAALRKVSKIIGNNSLSLKSIFPRYFY